jgi:isoquinoline 1-oxidoreductase subunit alpha
MTAMVTLHVNGESKPIQADWLTPLLWALRDELKLTGTKFGCGRGLCGACTVHIDGEAARSCSIMVGEVMEKHIVTIEGLSGDVAKAIQDAWVQAAVPQCGYCQPGFVMALASVLQHQEEHAKTREDVLKQMTNICRCGTYDAIRTAVDLALATLSKSGIAPPRREGRP